jgi:hypothetical protein
MKAGYKRQNSYEQKFFKNYHSTYTMAGFDLKTNSSTSTTPRSVWSLIRNEKPIVLFDKTAL